MSSTAPFDCAVSLIRRSRNVRFQNGTVEGEADLTDETVGAFRCLEPDNLLKNLVVEEASIVGKNYDLYIGKTARFEFRVPTDNRGGGYVVADLDELLRLPGRCQTTPDRFYLHDSDTCFPHDPSNGLIEVYRRAANLTACLISLAEFRSPAETPAEVSFLVPQREDMTVRYSAADLQRADLSKVEQVLAELRPAQPDHHAERRQEIFLRTVMEATKDVPKEVRLGTLLVRFGDLYARYRRDYDLYAKDFTFNKLQAEFEENKADQIKRLGAVVQDNAAKLLAIPLGYVVIAGQLVQQGGMKNVIIISSAGIFAILMTLLVVNLGMTLWHIKKDIDSLESKYSDRMGAEVIRDPLRQLRANFIIQFSILVVVLFVVWVVFLFNLLLFQNYRIS